MGQVRGLFRGDGDSAATSQEEELVMLDRRRVRARLSPPHCWRTVIAGSQPIGVSTFSGQR